MTDRFYVGQPVICVDGNFRMARMLYPDCTWPKKGGRYVVRRYLIRGRTPAIAVAEIRNRPVRYSDGVHREAGFWDQRFEPATEARVEELRALLKRRKMSGLPLTDEPDLPRRTKKPIKEKETTR